MIQLCRCTSFAFDSVWNYQPICRICLFDFVVCHRPTIRDHVCLSAGCLVCPSGRVKITQNRRFRRLFQSFYFSCLPSFIQSFIHSFIHTFIHTFIHSFIHSCIHKFLNSKTHVLAITWSGSYFDAFEKKTFKN